VIAALKQRIRQIPNVVAKPEPDVVIASFTAVGPVLAIRPYTGHDSYGRSTSTPNPSRISGPYSHAGTNLQRPHRAEDMIAPNPSSLRSSTYVSARDNLSSIGIPRSRRY
jgi:hypothetical protein